jgi:hypothetical protein
MSIRKHADLCEESSRTIFTPQSITQILESRHLKTTVWKNSLALPNDRGCLYRNSTLWPHILESGLSPEWRHFCVLEDRNSYVYEYAVAFHYLCTGLYLFWGLYLHRPPTFSVFYSSVYLISRRLRSEVGIATGYVLDDQGDGVRVRVGSKFSLHFFQTGSGAQPASSLGALSVG